MADDTFTVKINRRDGVVELTGSDKRWIAEQIERLAMVFEEPPPASPDQQLSAGPAAQLQDPPAARAGEPKARGRRTAARGRASRVPELEQKLTKPLKDKLQKWREEREAHWGKLSPQAAIIAAFLMDELRIDQVSPDDLYTVYVVMGWAPPGSPQKQLDNARARAGFFGPWSKGKLQLTHAGERFGRIEAKVPPTKK